MMMRSLLTLVGVMVLFAAVAMTPPSLKAYSTYAIALMPVVVLLGVVAFMAFGRKRS